MGQVLATCTFCGVGCALYLGTAGNHVVGVYPSMSHATNAGRICVRGWHVHEMASSPQRLKSPLLRLLQKFARTVISANNVDHGAGLYCNNSVDVLLEMIGVLADSA